GVQATIPSITRLMLTDRAKAEQLYRKSLRLVSVATGSVLILVLCVSPVMSIFWLQSVDYTLSLYVLILGLGWFFNAVGAPAYILGAATGVFRANIISSGLSLLLLGILGSVSGIVFGSAGVVAVVAFSLAASGLYIKNANERLLTPT
ncbi:MAG: hypothetical protein KKB02_07340, partial [Alphaproteobacteria bacterium]|nr:hypothetical protein [Alphaproteobacteria bacterium]